MFRFRIIVFLIFMGGSFLIACQPAATPFPEEEFIATEAPAEAEAPGATEAPVDVPTEAPIPPESDTSDSASLPTVAPPNESLPVNIVELTYENWSEEVDQSSLPVLLFFWEPANEYSTAMMPVVEDIANEYAGIVKVAAIDYSEYSELGSTFAIEQVPSLIFIINGLEQARIELTATREEIAQTIDEAIAMNPPIPLVPAELPANVVELTYENWSEEVDQSPLPVLLFFWEPGNRYSLAIMPAVEEITNKYAGIVKVLAINYSEYPEIGPNFGIQQVPTLLFMINGVEQGRLESTATTDEIAKMIDMALANNP